MQLELSDDEAVLLRRLLDTALRDLRQQVSHTDSGSFKRDLKDEEDLVRRVLDQLGGALPNPV